MRKTRLHPPAHFAVPLLALTVLTACIPRSTREGLPEAAADTRGQTLSQLHLQQEHTRLAAAWIPYFICERLLSEPDEAACTAQVTEYLRALHAHGIRTVFVHVCAFGETLYPSRYYPQAAAAGGHDGLAVFSEACKAADMQLHAWFNPLRLESGETMALQTDDCALTRIFADSAQRDTYLFLCGGRYYFNPAAEETADFLAGAAAEVTARYPVAGVHIDDYFYPSPDTEADAALFAASGETDLAAWRRDRVSALVKRLCDAVHAADSDAVFSVSPQGNLQLNRDTLFADVQRWLAEPGYCDLMLPQLYFGYENETCPFSETLAAWCALPRSPETALGVGLAAYKTGERDDFAGTGAAEWQRDSTVLQREIEEVTADPRLAGAALYHTDAVLAQAVRLPDKSAENCVNP